MFALQYSQVPAGSERVCPQSASLNVYVPGSLVPLNVPAAFTVCDMGTIKVSPVYGGT
jgi:hypothetical protein